MSVLCRLIGHKRQRGYYAWRPAYGRTRLFDVDGIGREHWAVVERCPRCSSDFEVACFHKQEEPTT